MFILSLNGITKKAVNIVTLFWVMVMFIVSSSDANAFASQKAYENYVTDENGTNYLDDSGSCSELNKFVNIFTLNDLYNIVMPTKISQDHDISLTDKLIITSEIVGPIMARAILYATLMTQLYNPVAGMLLMGAIATETIILFDVCTNVYVMQPHEYANYLMGGSNYVKSGKDSSGDYANIAPCAATPFDVQYYFQCTNNTQAGYSHTMCDPYVTCDASGVCSSNGTANTTCNPTSTPPIKPDPYHYSTHTGSFNGKVGTVVFAHDGGQAGFLNRVLNGRTRFSPRDLYSVKPNGGTGSGGRNYWMSQIPNFFTSYYRVNQSSGSIEGCLIAPFTFIPVLIGCAPIAPPLEEVIMTPSFAQRCAYIMMPRSDLNSLGTAIINGTLSGGSPGSYGVPIGRFLKSDLHFTSIMVGCVQDMVVSILTQDIAAAGASFLEIVQAKMSGVILATLSLYVALVGIKIMLSEGELKRSEYIMFLVKFAMVLYLNTGAFWCQTDNVGKPGLGVFPALIYGQNALSSMFVATLSANDPLAQCSYPFGTTGHLLTDQLVPPITTDGSSIVTTNGYSGVLLSVWDMIDCKMANYLNLGSCHYEGQGLLITMIIGLCALVPMAAAIFIFFAYFIISMVFKFARISVLVAIVLATLVIVSPIFACFMLFDKTMPMFQAWVKALIGNMLYPAFLMSYFCLMVMTLDTVYYGPLDLNAALRIISPGGEPATRTELLVQACKGSQSVYCATVSRMGDPCANDVSNFASQYSAKTTVGASTSTSYTIDSSVLGKYFIPMIRVMLFSLLFYFLMDASIGFLGTMAGAQAVASIGSSGILSALMSMFISKLISMSKSKVKGDGGGGGAK